MDGEHYRYHWDYLHPERYRAGNHGFIDTLSDNNENAIEQNPDMVVPAAQRTASQPPEVAY
jgi:hypothetical protein